jgi:hypothetical protein
VPQPNRMTRWLLAAFFVFAWMLAIFVCAKGSQWFASQMLSWFGIRSLRDAFEHVQSFGFGFLLLHTVWCGLGVAASLQGRRDVVILLCSAPMWMGVFFVIEGLHDPDWSAALAVQMIVWFVVVVVVGIYWGSKPADTPR